MNGWSFLVVTIVIGGIAMTCVIGMIITAHDGREIPPALASAASAAIGALAGHMGAMGYRLTNEERRRNGSRSSP